MDEIGYAEAEKEKINIHLNFIMERAKGNIPTGARFLRNLLEANPAYKKDSIITPECMYDLMTSIVELNCKHNVDGVRKQLLGE